MVNMVIVVLYHIEGKKGLYILVIKIYINIYRLKLLLNSAVFDKDWN